MLYDPKWETPVEVKPAEPWRERLVEAAQRIRQSGHCQHDYTNDGRYCLIGSIHGGYPGWDVTARQAENALYDYMRKHLKIDGVVDWNDTPGRTAEEAASLLERAAKE